MSRYRRNFYIDVFNFDIRRFRYRRKSNIRYNSYVSDIEASRTRIRLVPVCGLATPRVPPSATAGSPGPALPAPAPQLAPARLRRLRSPDQLEALPHPASSSQPASCRRGGAGGIGGGGRANCAHAACPAGSLERHASRGPTRQPERQAVGPPVQPLVYAEAAHMQLAPGPGSRLEHIRIAPRSESTRPRRCGRRCRGTAASAAAEMAARTVDQAQQAARRTIPTVMLMLEARMIQPRGRSLLPRNPR
jgi:hypothetical protein